MNNIKPRLFKASRLTYKSMFGDFGVAFDIEKLNEYEVIHKLANALGKYEDLGTVEELKAMKEAVHG